VRLYNLDCSLNLCITFTQYKTRSSDVAVAAIADHAV